VPSIIADHIVLSESVDDPPLLDDKLLKNVPDQLVARMITLCEVPFQY
jgi:hypothetical protein